MSLTTRIHSSKQARQVNIKDLNRKKEIDWHTLEGDSLLRIVIERT